MTKSTSPRAVRERQVKILEALSQRLSRGEELLPADLMARIAEELESRSAVEAVTKAWAEQGTALPNPWRGEAARASRRARGRDVREIQILASPEKALEALDDATWEEIAVEIDALAFDPSPRGALGLHGKKDDHVELRVGEWRLFYTVRANLITVVAVTHDPT